jgi:hypothetical protein
MHYLIDGHNLIARMADLSLDDPDDEAKLVRKLKGWALAGRKRRVTVIFDGRLAGGRSLDLSGGPVEVVFSPNNSSADELLIRRIKKLRNPAEHTLISSDREVLAAAGGRRMPSMVSEAFALFMTEDGARPALATAGDEPAIGEAEVAEWLELFGPVPERPAPAASRPEANRGDLPAAGKPPAKKAGRLAMFKEGDQKLAAEDVNAWLELFQEAEASPAAPPGVAPAGGRMAAETPPVPEGERPLATPKEGRTLDSDEVAAWLDVFKSGKPKGKK